MEKDFKEELMENAILKVSNWGGWRGGLNECYFITNDYVVYYYINKSLFFRSEYRINELSKGKKLKPEEIEEVNLFIENNFKNKESKTNFCFDSGFMVKAKNIILVNENKNIYNKTELFIKNLMSNYKKKIYTDVIFMLPNEEENKITNQIINKFNEFIKINKESPILVTAALVGNATEYKIFRKKVNNINEENLKKFTHYFLIKYNKTILLNCIVNTIDFFKKLNSDRLLLVVGTDEIKEINEMKNNNIDVIYVGKELKNNSIEKLFEKIEKTVKGEKENE